MKAGSMADPDVVKIQWVLGRVIRKLCHGGAA